MTEMVIREPFYIDFRMKPMRAGLDLALLKDLYIIIMATPVFFFTLKGIMMVHEIKINSQCQIFKYVTRHAKRDELGVI